VGGIDPKPAHVLDLWKAPGEDGLRVVVELDKTINEARLGDPAYLLEIQDKLRVVYSDADVAEYLRNGWPVTNKEFEEIFQLSFNRAYGVRLIQHGTLRNGLNNPEIFMFLYQRGGPRYMLGLYTKPVFAFDANGYIGGFPFLDVIQGKVNFPR
jgi:hypothetical protein